MILFISNPRTGTNSWHKALGYRKYNHVARKKIQGNFDYEFGFVRNPYSRIVSWYEFHKSQGWKEYQISFKDWIELACPTHWSNELRNSLGIVDPLDQWGYFEDSVQVFKYEQMKDAIDVISSKTGKGLYLPHINKSGANKWDRYYTDDLKRIVYKLYEKDFDLFEYSR